MARRGLAVALLGSSGLTAGGTEVGCAQHAIPNEGYRSAWAVSLPLSGANLTRGLIGPGPAVAFRLSGNAVAVRTEPLGLGLSG